MIPPSKVLEWKERKISILFSSISLVIFIATTLITIMLIILTVIGLINNVTTALMFFLLGLVFCSPFSILSSLTSDGKKYTKDFIIKIKDMLDKCESLEDLEALRSYFEYQAINCDGIYRLSYPEDIRKIHIEIIHKIEILEKINNK
jgi:hypothetical protein